MSSFLITLTLQWQVPEMIVKILPLVNDLSFLIDHIQLYVNYKLPPTNHLPVCTWVIPSTTLTCV